MKKKKLGGKRTTSKKMDGWGHRYIEVLKHEGRKDEASK
jgi:hypothetical protein